MPRHRVVSSALLRETYPADDDRTRSPSQTFVTLGTALVETMSIKSSPDRQEGSV
jgi:hypothetical protein